MSHFGPGIIEIGGADYLLVHKDHQFIKFLREEKANSATCDPLLLGSAEDIGDEPKIDHLFYKVSRDLMTRISCSMLAKRIIK